MAELSRYMSDRIAQELMWWYPERALKEILMDRPSRQEAQRITRHHEFVQLCSQISELIEQGAFTNQQVAAYHKLLQFGSADMGDTVAVLHRMLATAEIPETPEVADESPGPKAPTVQVLEDADEDLGMDT